jgi:hypothetical protein
LIKVLLPVRRASFEELMTASMLGFDKKNSCRSYEHSAFRERLFSANAFHRDSASFAKKIEPDAVASCLVHNEIKSVSQAQVVTLLQLAFKDAELHPLSEALQTLMDLRSSSIVLNIV